MRDIQPQSKFRKSSGSVADTTTRPAHGTLAAATAHKRADTMLCDPCLDESNDYHQAWRIASGKNKTLRVPISVLRAVLAGADLATTLGSIVGPRALNAIRTGEVPRG